MITEPGVYDGIDEITYHADNDLAPELGRSLSASGAKTLLHSPTRFAYEREHGRPPKDEFDMGTVVHALVLRSGDRRIRVIPADNWRTKVAQEAKADAHENGLVPVLAKDVRKAIAIAKHVRSHPIAHDILAVGRPEVTLYWIDPATGITCRARIDWVHPEAIVDVKTVGRYGGADPDTFGRQAANLDYPLSAAHYVDGWEHLTGQALPFITIAVELEPPHVVTVGYYLPADLDAGRERMARARAIYAERESSGVWTDPPEVVAIPIPLWYERQSA